MHQIVGVKAVVPKFVVENLESGEVTGPLAFIAGKQKRCLAERIGMGSVAKVTDG